jgi:N-acetylneuraminate synthase/N,N'-diacetyllegionaminate synthase
MKRTFSIGGREIGDGAPPYVIAEIGVNHDGDVERAVALVHAAAAAGANAVKFQWFSAEDLVATGAECAGYQQVVGRGDQQTLLRPLELAAGDFERAIAAAHEASLHAIVTVFSPGLVAQASVLGWDAWKTASPDLVHQPLLERLASEGRPMIVSTGAATLEEVKRAAAWISQCPAAFLQCVSAYPTREAAANLGGIEALRSATGAVVGYSDHTTETTTGGLAVAAGAAILEKHLTWNSSAAGPDHGSSLDPAAFATYVEFARRAHEALGPRLTKDPQGCEGNVRMVARQSLRAATVLGAGHVLRAEDIVIKRPADGAEPWELGTIIGRALRRDLCSDAPITHKDLGQP